MQLVSMPLFSWAPSAAGPSAMMPNQCRGARPHGGTGGNPTAPAMPVERGAREEARRTTEVQGACYGVNVVGGSPAGAIHGGATRVVGERW
jgi:hypothetical protein